MSALTIEKVLSLPETPASNVIYLVKPPGTTLVNMYFSSADGSTTYNLNGVDESVVKSIVSTILTGLMGTANGIATLDGNKLLKVAQFPKVFGANNTFAKVDVDVYGRVIAGGNLTDSDIPDLSWDKIIYNLPNTLAGYGITDALATGDIVTTATANKILRLNANAELPANITGTAAAAKKLSTGRSIKMTGDVTWSIPSFTGESDVSAAGTLSDVGVAAGTYNTATHIRPLTIDSKGRVTVVGDELPLSPDWANIQNRPSLSVDWGAIQNKPAYLTTLSSDYLKVEETTKVAAADKILYLNANAKLETDLVGNADTATKLKDPFKIQTTGDVEIDTGDIDGSVPISVLGNLKTIPGLIAGIYGDSSGFFPYEIDKNGRIVKVHDKVAVATSWANVGSTPTTLAGYGITDGVNISEVVSVATANKILRLDSNAELPTSITGNSASTDKLATSVKVKLEGEVAGEVTTDFSGDVIINAVLTKPGESFHPFLLFGG